MRISSRRMMPVLLLVAALMVLVGAISVSAQDGVVESDVSIALPGIAPTPAATQPNATQPNATQAALTYGVAASGSYAYLGQENKLVIVNVSNPASPVLAGQTGDLGGTVYDIAISGNYAFVGTGNGQLKIVNISNPGTPTVSATYTAPGSVEGVAISGNYAYITDNVGLQIINISNPVSPFLAGSYGNSAYSTSVALAGNYAYVVSALSSKFYVINVSNPASPTLAGVYDTTGWPSDVSMSGNYAHVMTWSPHAVQVLNISNPANIFKISEYPYAGSKGIKVIGNYSYASAGGTFRIINVSNPAAPTLSGTFSPLDNAWDMVVNGSYAYTSERSGMSIINISNPAAPSRVGFFSTNEPPDTTAPEVTWVEPVSAAQTATVYGQSVQLRADATDNIGVTKVVFKRWDYLALTWITLVEDTSAPYTFSLNSSTLNPNSNQINAEAYDAAGNGDSEYIWVSLQAPQAPTINTIANSDGDGSYNVSWTSSTGATGYEVEESLDNGSWSQIYSGTNLSTSRTGRSPGTWCYRVRAANKVGDGAWSGNQCTTVAQTSDFTYFISPSGSATIGGNPSTSADILRYNKSTNTWTMVYDGSVRGTPKNVSAFDRLNDGSFLLVFAANQPIVGLGTATPYDVVKFTPNIPNNFPLGSGTYTWYFQGKSQGLTTTSEKIDAIDLAGDRLLLSTVGTAKLPLLPSGTLTAADEDVFAYNRATGRWESALIIDGSKMTGMATEDISGVWDDPNSTDYYITIVGAFNLGGVRGNGKSIVKLTPNGAASVFTPSLVSWLAPGATFPTNLDGMDMAR